MSNIVQMPGGVEMATFAQIDDGKWTTTERLLNDERRDRRLVRY
jgi:hypothetical protein